MCKARDFSVCVSYFSGRCSVEHFPSSLAFTESNEHIPTSPKAQQLHPHTHILLAGNVTITASSTRTQAPAMIFAAPNHPPYSLGCPEISDGIHTQITMLALDQSQPSVHEHQHVRLISFLSTGAFHLFSVNHVTPSASHHVGTYAPQASVSRARVTPIVQSVYHHPLLVTLSESFHLSLYDLSNPEHITHSQTLTSYTSYPPTSLVLSCPSPSTYKLVLAYAVPVYPEHWSVGATELIIRNDRTEASTHAATSMLTVANTRSTKAFDIPPGWVDEHKMQAVKEQWSRKVTRVADTQTDGKWVILAPGDPSSPGSPASQHTPTSLQLYRLHLPASPTSSAIPRLSFVRTLYGHMGPVSALSVADGRCVSLGANGSIWVWDLEGGTGAEVSPSYWIDEDSKDFLSAFGEGKRGAVAFDERRIVTANARGIEVRRFDI